MVVDHVDIAERYVCELWEERDLAVLEALVDEQYVLRDPISVLEGRDALAARLRDMPWSEVMIIIEDVVASGERAFVRCTWQAVHTGMFFGVEPTNKRVVVDVVQALTFGDGKIVEDMTYYDVYAVFEQIGALPSMDKLVQPKKLAPVLRLVP
jgi:predicted ester cyclase